MLALFYALMNSKRGVTAVEYGLIAALVSVAIIGAVSTLGGNLSDVFNSIATKVGTGTAAAANN